MVMHKSIDALGVAVLAALHKTPLAGLDVRDVGGGTLYDLSKAILDGLAESRIELIQGPARLGDTWTWEILSDTCGVTEPALTALRNQLALRVDHRVEIAHLPALDVGGDCDGYGLAIVDLSREHLVIIGDGFRGDGGGEGGAGHIAAQALLSIYGFDSLRIHRPVDPIPFGPETDWIAVAGAVLRTVQADVGYPACDRFHPSLAEGRAGYIRHLAGHPSAISAWQRERETIREILTGVFYLWSRDAELTPGDVVGMDPSMTTEEYLRHHFVAGEDVTYSDQARHSMALDCAEWILRNVSAWWPGSAEDCRHRQVRIEVDLLDGDTIPDSPTGTLRCVACRADLGSAGVQISGPGIPIDTDPGDRKARIRCRACQAVGLPDPDDLERILCATCGSDQVVHGGFGPEESPPG